MPRHRSVRVAGAALLAMLAAACGSGPNQAGAALIVGDDRVPLAQVQERMHSVLERDEKSRRQLEEQGQLGDLSRSIVTYEVQHELLAEAQRRYHLSVNEQQVSALLERLGGPERAAENTFFDAAGIRKRARDQLLAAELGKRYVDQLSVNIDYTSASSRAQADELVNKFVSSPESVGEIIEQRNRPQQRGELGLEIQGADNTQLASTALFSTPVNSVVALQLQSGSGQWLVAVVRDRTAELADKATGGQDSGGQDSGDQNSERSPQAMEGVGTRMLAPLAREVGVRVSPRYGVFDPIGMTVVAGEDETAGFQRSLNSRQ